MPPEDSDFDKRIHERTSLIRPPSFANPLARLPAWVYWLAVAPRIPHPFDLVGDVLVLPAIVACLVLWAPGAAVAQPILWYDFDTPSEPAVNLGTLGAAWNGDLLNETHFVAFGSGFAVALDGNSDWVLPLGAESAFDIGDGDFTLFTRQQTTVVETGCAGAERGLVWKEKTGLFPGYTFGVIKDTGLPRLSLFDGATFVSAVGATPVNDGMPHDLHAVRRGDALLVFEDGRLTATAAVPAAFGSTNNDNRLVIGGRTLAAAGCSGMDDFNGIIDEVRIHADAEIPSCSSAPHAWVDLRLQPGLLSWCVPQAVSAFDIVRGDLGALRATGGDYSVATQECLASAHGDAWLEYPPTPQPGTGVWFLVRDVDGNYDTGEPSQSGTRDPEIAASGHDCP